MIQQGARALLAAALILVTPWLLGGVAQINIVFTLVVSATLVALCRDSQRGPLRLPSSPAARSLLVLGAVACLSPWLLALPWPQWLLEWLAPRAAAQIQATLALTDSSTRGVRLHVDPTLGQRESLRALGFVAVFVLGTRWRWQQVAACVAVSATLVALCGLVHDMLAAERIFGFYSPREVAVGSGWLARGPFVNPNHQSALLLLGLACCAGTALALQRSRSTNNPSFAAMAATPEHALDRTILLAVAGTLIWIDLWALASRAALVVALVWLVLASLVALGPTLGSRPLEPFEPRERVRTTLVWLGLVVTACGLPLYFGAGRELARSWPGGADWPTVVDKIEVLRATAELSHYSPWVGLGRGSFASWAPLEVPMPMGVRIAHIECWPLWLLVEYGWIFTAVSVMGLSWWFIDSWRRHETPGRVVLLGIAAVALQNLADFNLEYSGVALAIAALMGALTGEPEEPSVAQQSQNLHGHRSSWALSGFLLAAALVAGFIAGPKPGDLRWTPLDPSLHLDRARAHAQTGDVNRARAHVERAIEFAPNQAAPRLLRAWLPSRSTSDASQSGRDLRAAFERLAPARYPEISALLGQRWRPSALAERLLPTQASARELSVDNWLALVRALGGHSPVHADDLLARLRRHAQAFAVDGRSDIALHSARRASARGHHLTAEHQAESAVANTPDRPDTWLTLTAVLRARSPDLESEIRKRLDDALTRPKLDDVGALEEAWLYSASLDPGGPADPNWPELARRLAQRTADSSTMRRRQALIRRLQACSQGQRQWAKP